MPIFSSRSIENALLRLGRVLPEEQVRSFMSKMKAGETNAISAEWEIVVLEAFERIGKISHETEGVGGVRPDLWFSDSWTRMPNFVAEIKTVFQQNAEFHDYKDYFFTELVAVIQKSGFDLPGFSFRVEQYEIEGKLRCCAPDRGDVSPYLNSRVLRELAWRKREGQRGFRAQFFERDKNYNFTLDYDQKKEGFEFHFPPDAEKDDPKNVRDHVLWKALEKARKKLKGVSDDTLKAAILCDAGCSYLREKPRGWRGWDEKTYKDFLNERGGLDFILAITTERNNDPFEFSRRHLPRAGDRVKLRVFSVKDELGRLLEREFERLAGEFPDVVLHPTNAAQGSRPSWFWGTRVDRLAECLWGSSKTEGKYFLVSASGLAKVLAGELDPEMLFNKEDGNPIKREIEKGSVLTVAHVAHLPDQDDDVVALRWIPKELSVDSEKQAEKSIRHLVKLRQQGKR